MHTCRPLPRPGPSQLPRSFVNRPESIGRASCVVAFSTEGRLYVAATKVLHLLSRWISHDAGRGGYGDLAWPAVCFACLASDGHHWRAGCVKRAALYKIVFAGSTLFSPSNLTTLLPVPFGEIGHGRPLLKSCVCAVCEGVAARR